MQTITRHNRNVTLDIIRGFAVLGILLVNISFFSTSLQAIQFQVELWPETWNQVTQSVLDWLVQGKFIAIFSFLFGYGMILFKERMEEKGIPFPSLFLRRLFALLIFGLLHGMFIWYGDILVHYALLGFVLLLFHNRRPKTLMIWAVLSLLLIPLLSLLSSENSGSMPLSEEYQQQVEFIIELDTAIYGNGTFSEIQQLRMRDWISSFINQLVFYPQLLGLFLLGAYFAKRKILDPNSSSRLLWRITLGAGGAGLILTFLPLLCKPIIAESLAWEYRFIAFKQLLGAPLLGIGYLCLIALLCRKGIVSRALQPLANVGRMAFTNYLLQSLICTSIFYSYGLGFFGQVDLLRAVLLSLVIFGVQLVFSTCWMKYFQYGPFEWLWRLFTYWSFPPFRKQRKPLDSEY